MLYDRYILPSRYESILAEDVIANVYPNPQP
jgi:hypothetical protein